MLTRALASIIQAPTARPWQVWWSDTATRLTDQMQTLEIYQSIRSSSKRRKSTGRLYCTIAVDAKSGCKIQINSWTSAQRQKMTWRDNGEKNDEIMRNYLTTFITAANGKTLPSTSSVPQKNNWNYGERCGSEFSDNNLWSWTTQCRRKRAQVSICQQKTVFHGFPDINHSVCKHSKVLH